MREEFNDGHFDLEDPMQLVTKSLKWFALYLPEWKSDLLALTQKIESHEGEEPFVVEEQLSEKVLEALNKVKPEQEKQLMNTQTEVRHFWVGVLSE